MKFKVRNYSYEADYQTVQEWWKSANLIEPSPGMMPEDSSFAILNKFNVPIAFVSLWLTNAPDIAWVENLISNPKIDSEIRSEAVTELQGFLDKFASNLGYKKLACFTSNPKLLSRYQELGYNITMPDVAILVKDIGRA